MGSHSKVLECQVLFGVSLCFMCFSWQSITGHYASIKVCVAGILGRRGGGTKLSSRSCSSGKSQQCQC